MADLTFAKQEGLRADQNQELSETLGDIRAMSFLGEYDASKIRRASQFKLFQESGQKEYQSKAVQELEKAWGFWQQYAGILDTQYAK
jgi:hypothetical protein